MTFLLALLLSPLLTGGVKQITMTQGQYCKSCVATVEAIFEYTQKESKATHSLDLQGATVAKKMCNASPFIYYKDFFTTGCEQIVKHNLTNLVKPIMNKNLEEADKIEGETRTTTGNGMSTVFGSDTLKFEHQKQFCQDIGACPATFFAMGRETVKDRCRGCTEFVWDFKVVLAREKEVTPKRVVDVLTTVCEKISLLHLRPGKIEDACEEFVESWYEGYLEQHEKEPFIRTIVDNMHEIMHGQYDIVTPVCSEYTKICKPKKNKKKRRKKKKSRAGVKSAKKSKKDTKTKARKGVKTEL